MEQWVGIDLDGTLAFYDDYKGLHHIGAPIPLMVQRVKDMLAKGIKVKIFTARVSDPTYDEEAERVIQDWTEKYMGARLEVTNVKDFGMKLLYDDRARQVEENTGIVIKR